MKFALSALLFSVSIPLSAGLLEETRVEAAELWVQTQALAGDAWSGGASTSVIGGERNGHHSKNRGTAMPAAIGDPLEIPANANFNEVWDDVLPRLEETLQLTDEQTALPDSTWFGRDKQQVAAEVDGLLDEAITILGVSDADSFRARIRELEQRIKDAQHTITAYRQQRVTAPKDSMWETTVENYDEKIADLEDEIKQTRQQLAEQKRGFSQRLRELGLDLTDEQLDFLFSTVVGEDIIRMGIAFENVRVITVKLEELVEASSEELESAKRYYGMYTVLLNVLDQMYRHLSHDIEKRYLPEIAAISQRADTLMTETRNLMRESPDKRHILKTNLEAQALTLRTGAMYHEYLVSQHREVIAAQQRLAKEVRVALNTYETVKVSGELMGLVNNSRHLLSTLKSMQIPELRGFENIEMKREFSRLTEQMQVRE